MVLVVVSWHRHAQFFVCTSFWKCAQVTAASQQKWSHCLAQMLSILSILRSQLSIAMCLRLSFYVEHHSLSRDAFVGAWLHLYPIISFNDCSAVGMFLWINYHSQTKSSVKNSAQPVGKFYIFRAEGIPYFPPNKPNFRTWFLGVGLLVGSSALDQKKNIHFNLRKLLKSINLIIFIVRSTKQ